MPLVLLQMCLRCRMLGSGPLTVSRDCGIPLSVKRRPHKHRHTSSWRILPDSPQSRRFVRAIRSILQCRCVTVLSSFPPWE